MSEIPPHFQIKAQGKASPESIVVMDSVRFSLLTSRMIRMEYDPLQHFEDRPTQIFWHRKQPKPAFSVVRDDRHLEIVTDHLHLRYTPAHPGEGFSSDNLSVEILATGEVWQYGMEETKNLKGTLRTLDTVDGYAPLEKGLLSRDGWTLVDDTRGLVFNEQGWIEPRQAHPDYVDLYFLGYGLDYEACIQDYYRVSGPPALIPRWVLGNWWSRYWEYTQDELQHLMLEFKAREVPLSVCIIDMDWHITQTGNESSGWTGYTWNRKLFPDPPALIRFLHSLGLKTALNLHPAAGIYPHEEQYVQMAEAMGIDPASKKPVPFEPEDPKFVVPYFKYLHHPQEEEYGIDFWWMDWQQGNPSRLPNLNLLWWINHIHFHDLGRKKEKRPFIFSRWGGLGNQRYPIGFSGDTIVSWESLAFQPYLTATAANVGFGWWSHDIGGHMNGTADAELYTRWVQLGVFSPILRLHSTKDRFQERRPWGYDQETFETTRYFMQLRHMLIPYLYSMAWRDHKLGIPLARPMYHHYPATEQAYVCPNQYEFGSELVAAPFITPKDHDTRLARQIMWLPKGLWFDFFNGRCVPVTQEDGKWVAVYGDIRDVPVYAKAGAIVPLGARVGWGGIGNPEKLTIRVFPGADNQFSLFEDDGESQSYLEGGYAITRLSQSWQRLSDENRIVFRMEPAEGKVEVIPPQREYEFEFFAIRQPRELVVLVNGEVVVPESFYDPESRKFCVPKLLVRPTDTLELILKGIEIVSEPDWEAEFLRVITAFRLSSQIKLSLHAAREAVISQPERLSAFQVALSRSQMRALIEIFYSAGFEHITNTGEELIVLWNNENRKEFSWLLSAEQRSRSHPSERFRYESGTLPIFHVVRPAEEFELTFWNRRIKAPGLIQVDFGNLLRAKIPFNPNKHFPFI